MSECGQRQLGREGVEIHLGKRVYDWAVVCAAQKVQSHCQIRPAGLAKHEDVIVLNNESANTRQLANSTGVDIEAFSERDSRERLVLGRLSVDEALNLAA